MVGFGIHKPIIEFEQVILSFGEDVKVLQPESLATRISARVQAMVGMHEVK
jgi:predicted DNA-binding transcriptional regulator YafY